MQGPGCSGKACGGAGCTASRLSLLPRVLPCPLPRLDLPPPSPRLPPCTCPPQTASRAPSPPSGCLSDAPSCHGPSLPVPQGPLPADRHTSIRLLTPQPGDPPSYFFSPLLPPLPSGQSPFHPPPTRSSLSAFTPHGPTESAASRPRDLGSDPHSAGCPLWDLRRTSSPLNLHVPSWRNEHFHAFSNVKHLPCAQRRSRRCPCPGR